VVHSLTTADIVLLVAVFIPLQRGNPRARLICPTGATDLRRSTIALDGTAKRLSRSARLMPLAGSPTAGSAFNGSD